MQLELRILTCSKSNSQKEIFNEKRIANAGGGGIDPDDPSQYIEFIARQTTNTYGITVLYSDNGFAQYAYYLVNGERQSNGGRYGLSLKFNEGDTVKLVYGKYEYDQFSGVLSYSTQILGGRIPKLATTNATRLCQAFCSTVAPHDLFYNNPQFTDFTSCFALSADEPGLQIVEEGIFDCCPNATSFGDCFYNCRLLESVPKNLFSVHTKATNFSGCFASCRKLAVDVQIGSLADSVNVSQFARNTSSTGTVYCREGSAAYTAFSESTDANVNVLTY